MKIFKIIYCCVEKENIIKILDKKPYILSVRFVSIPFEQVKMATSKGANTYNRQNWEDAVILSYFGFNF